MNYLTQTQQPVRPIDSTSFVYTNAEEFVPLTDYFLNFKYLDSKHLQKNPGSSGKLSAEILTENTAEKSNITLQYTDWVLFILLGLFALVAFVRITGKNYLHRVFTSVVNYSYSNSFFKEKNLAYTLNNNLLMIVFFFSSALFLNVLVDYFNFTEVVQDKWQQFFLYTLFILLLVTVYRLVYRLLGLIIGYYAEVSEYLFFFGNALKILGIAYVILIFGSFFSTGTGKTIFVYSTLILTILMFFVKFYRILIIFFRNRFPLFYMILYFCALEIIPVILLMKIFALIGQNEFTFIDLLV